MDGNFKFEVQDSFLEYFYLEIGRFEKWIALSEKMPPLALQLKLPSYAVIDLNIWRTQYPMQRCVSVPERYKEPNGLDLIECRKKSIYLISLYFSKNSQWKLGYVKKIGTK